MSETVMSGTITKGVATVKILNDDGTEIKPQPDPGKRISAALMDVATESTNDPSDRIDARRLLLEHGLI